MGQQQLLLVILVTVIVGIATVVAINTFGSAADNANVDAVRQDLVSMAAAAQSYYLKPAALGGSGQTFAGITFDNLGSVSCDPTEKNDGTASTDAATCGNQNGDYTISGAGANEFTITATPSSAGGSIDITVNRDDATMGTYSAP